MDYLGVDISKGDFHTSLLQNGRSVNRTFFNTAKGFAQLIAWLRNRKTTNLVVCMEATGSYWQDLAAALFDVGYTVTVINPKRIKAFAESELLRAKTDAVDAALITRFVATQKWDAWIPPAPEVRELQGFSRHLEFLKRSRAQYLTRIKTPGLPARVIDSTQQLINKLDVEVKDLERAIRDHINRHPGLKSKDKLLQSIPGIGETTSATILSEMPEIEKFSSVGAVAAYAGLSPLVRQSGSSVRGKPTLCKTGNSRLRKALYFPAMSAKRHNPTLRPFSDRLKALGKHKMLIIGAIMRKLLVLAYGVVKSGKPYAPDFRAARA
jgi:transposase